MSIRDVELFWLWRVLLPSLLLFYCACLISVTVHATGLLAAPHGAARIVQLALEGHLAAGVMVALQIAVGVNILRAFGKRANELQEWVAALVIGFWAFDVVAFGLSLLGVLGATSAVSSTAALYFVSWVLASRASPRARAAKLVPTIANRRLTLAAGILALIAVTAWLWPLLVQTALPNSDWDSALYHLPLAERYLAGEVWNHDPLFSAYSFPGGVSLLYAVFLAFDLEHAIVPFNFLFVLATLIAIYALGRRLAGSWGGAWSLLVAFGLHVLWQQGVDPRIDGFLSFFIVAAALALAGALSERGDRAWPAVLGAALGLAIGAKYTGVFIAGAFAFVWIGAVLLARNSQTKGPPAAAFGTALVLVLFPHGAWYASNLALHGDPLFPMLRGDYYTDDARPGERIAMTGALDAQLVTMSPETEALARRLEATKASEVEHNLFDLPDLVVHPDRYATKPNHFVSPLLLLCLALPLAGPRDPRRRVEAFAIATIALACFVGIASQTNLIRYALPFFGLMAALSGVVLARVTHPAWRVAWFVAGAAILLDHHGAEVDKLARLQPETLSRLDGDRLGWLRRVGYNFTPAMPIVVSEINQLIEKGEVAGDSRILLAGEGKGRLLGCDSLPDLSWFLQRFAVELLRADFEPQRVLASLESQGVTHVLYNPMYFRWVAAHTAFSKRQIAFTMVQLEYFLEQHGSLVFERAGMKFVRLAFES